MEAALRANLDELRASWPGGIVLLEPTTALDCYYTDGRAVGAAFKLTFSATSYYDTAYVYPNGEFWTLYNKPLVDTALKTWVASVRTRVAGSEEQTANLERGADEH